MIEKFLLQFISQAHSDDMLEQVEFDEHESTWKILRTEMLEINPKLAIFEHFRSVGFSTSTCAHRIQHALTCQSVPGERTVGGIFESRGPSH